MEQTDFLTLEQELQLGELIQKGCLESKLRFLEAYKTLVYNLAYKHKGNFEIDDMVQEGTIGLMIAIEKYDPTRGLKLSTIAVPWIIQKMQRYKRNNHTIRFPCHIHDRWLKIEKVKEQYQEKGITLSDKELEAKLGHKIITPYGNFTSLNERVKGQEKGTYSDVIPDKTDIENDVLSLVTKEELVSIMASCLEEREKTILQLRYGFEDKPQTYNEVAEVFGLSRERIRQIQIKAENKLKRKLTKIGYKRH